MAGAHWFAISGLFTNDRICCCNKPDTKEVQAFFVFPDVNPEGVLDGVTDRIQLQWLLASESRHSLFCTHVFGLEGLL